MAPSTFLLWVSNDETLAEQYAGARDSMIDAIADETIKIADEMPLTHPITGAIDSASVAKQKLQVDTRKWMLAKLAPKRYGERIELDGGLTVSPVLDLLVAMAKPVEQK
jgi:hypothetical protein